MNQAIIGIIVNALLGIAATAAATFSGLTYRLARNTFLEEKERKRAFMAPHDNPGLVEHETLDDPGTLVMRLRNYGEHPASKLDLTIATFNEADISGENVPPRPVSHTRDQAANPIPPGGSWTLQYKFDDVVAYGASKYVLLMVGYRDEVVQVDIAHEYYWDIEDDSLVEVPVSTARRIKALYEDWKVSHENT